MEKEQVKLAFLKVKEDILNLKSEMFEIKNIVKNLYSMLNTKDIHESSDSTIRQITSTNSAVSTDTSTVRQEIEGFKPTNLSISIGNEGVSTDRQTDRQTDTSTQNMQKNLDSDLQEAHQIFNSLDSIKKQIRIKFKKITPQEMLVFSAIYQLEEQRLKEITYKEIATFLNLSESSIRDYIQRIIMKGIPIKKQKINNKRVALLISPELKKIASLSTIISLREL